MSININTVHTASFCCCCCCCSYNWNQHSSFRNINSNIIIFGIRLLFRVSFLFSKVLLVSWSTQKSCFSDIFLFFDLIFSKNHLSYLLHTTHLCPTQCSLFIRTLFIYFILSRFRIQEYTSDFKFDASTLAIAEFPFQIENCICGDI